VRASGTKTDQGLEKNIEAVEGKLCFEECQKSRQSYRQRSWVLGCNERFSPVMSRDSGGISSTVQIDL
jgi:hypothetical protein